ncbi:FMN-binding negative transcriptional regulator [Gillisia sp. CAL575]|uniref:FMN-binding negative transcriptional regulator n=1 Tax=Gillisia sp. CAL575 TaxID=985255 RepID=UPI0003AAB77A|nr:FMN-binding negative transcriptional regulator [Gillisia sp. CAL575]
MYQPKKYKKQDPEYLFDFINEHPFASFVLKGERLMATHIPVLIEGNFQNYKLYAHIANHNEQLEFLKDEVEALMIFQGAHGYVSSSWYQDKDISTWDYSAVHVNVKLKLQTNEELQTSLLNLVHRFEKNQANPLYYNDIPKQMLEDHLPLITGFWAEPIKIEGVAKLHQSYNKKDVESVITHLNEGDALSKELSKNIREENNGSN